MKVGAWLVTRGATAGFDEHIYVRYVWTFEKICSARTAGGAAIS